jgi:hypothetical protein
MKLKRPNSLTALGLVIIILGTINVIVYIVTKIGDPLQIAALLSVGVMSRMTGNGLRALDERIAKIERQREDTNKGSS